ncbi:MAG TPA: glycosyltransferase [Fimbriiglobus sp.]|jgi:glycosyltransferase involved in cell wall biosynthesis|nr:glycosyltransferase [Fimbriiglobus sp.]
MTQADPLRLAVVVPTLNEAAHLPATLRSLAGQSAPAARLVVADGGSADRTVELARKYGANVLVVSGRGRGGQVAAAVAQLDEEVVLIAHADMVFSPGALERIRHHLAANPDCPGGCLGHRFDSAARVYRMMEWFDRRRALRGDSYGDQAQFFRRDRIGEVGGFPDLPLMEDVELARRLRRLGRPAYLNVPVTVSPRRFEHRGMARVMWANWRFRRAYRRDGAAACRAIYERYYS